jgi:hypothetical protein
MADCSWQQHAAVAAASALSVMMNQPRYFTSGGSKGLTEQQVCRFVNFDPEQ